MRLLVPILIVCLVLKHTKWSQDACSDTHIVTTSLPKRTARFFQTHPIVKKFHKDPYLHHTQPEPIPRVTKAFKKW